MYILLLQLRILYTFYIQVKMLMMFVNVFFDLQTKEWKSLKNRIYATSFFNEFNMKLTTYLRNKEPLKT